jgi:hypothetical protein
MMPRQKQTTRRHTQPAIEVEMPAVLFDLDGTLIDSNYSVCWLADIRLTPNRTFYLQRRRLPDYRNSSMPVANAGTLSLWQEVSMPEQETVDRAREDAREGKSPSTQAGEFVREEMHHVREGKHGAASTKQAIAIGLSKARRGGVKLQAPRNGKASARTTKQARRDLSKGHNPSRRKRSVTRSRATREALKKEGHSAASHRSLSKQARSAAKKRSSRARHNSAVRASRTRRKRG